MALAAKIAGTSIPSLHLAAICSRWAVFWTWSSQLLPGGWGDLPLLIRAEHSYRSVTWTAGSLHKSQADFYKQNHDVNVQSWLKTKNLVLIKTPHCRIKNPPCSYRFLCSFLINKHIPRQWPNRTSMQAASATPLRTAYFPKETVHKWCDLPHFWMSLLCWLLGAGQHLKTQSQVSKGVN